MLPYLFVYSDWALLALRIFIGGMFILRGLPKFTNLHETAKRFNDAGFFPGFFWGTSVAMVEVFGGFFLGVGFLAQVVASLLILLTLAAITASLRDHTFRGSYDSNLVLLPALLVILTLGPGVYSADAFFNIMIM